MNGFDLLTTADQGETLADLSCQSGELAKYDVVLGWQCDLDNDTSDWNALSNVPAGLQMAWTMTLRTGTLYPTSPLDFLMGLTTN